MSDLAAREFQPFKKGDQALTDTEIKELLTSLTDWQVVVRDKIPRLEKNYKFPDFNKALEFATLVGELAESVDHHPTILISWGRTAVSWWTFDVDGLLENDFILAARTDQLFQDKHQ